MNEARLGYYRTPALFGERLVFSSGGDLWEVSRTGGHAQRLIDHEGLKLRPAFSPDGKWISYSCQQSAGFEIHVAESDGRNPRQFTFLGSVARNIGWHKDQLLFASQARLAFPSALWLFSASLAKPEPRQIPWGPVSHATFHEDGTCVLGRHEISEYSARKGYRGGGAGQLWIDRKGDGQFRRLLSLPGSLTRPSWVGDRVYFLTDHEGIGNLASCLRDGSDLQLHSEHREFYARHLSGDEHSLVYSHGGDLYLFETSHGKPVKIEIELASSGLVSTNKGVDIDRPSAVSSKARKDLEVESSSVSLAATLEGFDFEPTQGQLAFIARGQAFVRDGSAPSELRKLSDQRVRFLKRRKESHDILALCSDGIREELIVFGAPDLSHSTTISGPDLGRAKGLQISPANPDHLVIANDRFELWLIDLRDGKSRLIGRSSFDEVQGFAWSPDGQWLAFGCPLSEERSVLRLVHLESGKTGDLATGGLKDFAPCFDPDLGQLFFLSETLVPGGDDIAAGGLRKKWRIGSLSLTNADPTLDLPKAHMLSVNVGLPRGLECGRGTLFLSRQSDAKDDGCELLALDVSQFPTENRAALTRVASGISIFHAENREVVFVSNGQFFLASRQNDSLSFTSELLFDARESKVAIDHRRDWLQIFDETWKSQADHFWNADMNRVDWEKIRTRYRPLVERISTRAELTDLLWEVLGELRSSHAYAGYAAPSQGLKGSGPGHLGADVSFQNGRWRIDRILRDDAWEPATGSPLGHPQDDVREGDEILAIDGHSLKENSSFGSLLVGGHPAKLSLRRHSEIREINVNPLKSEATLRYRDLIRRSRNFVSDQSDGQCGYVQIPNTHAGGYAEFYRQFLLQFDRAALIIDARNSSGGNAGPEILDRLARLQFAEVRSRWAQNYSFPQSAPPPLMILLINEYTGSDSEVLAHGFRLRGLGPLVGQRTWGGVFGYKSRLIAVDGGYTTRPQTAFLLEGLDGQVENHGIEPDYEAEQTPQDEAEGRDRQLDFALKKIREMTKEAAR